MTELDVYVNGRPAPQGSKHYGAHGQMREASVYLPAWQQAIKRTVFERYRALGMLPEDLPLFRGPVAVGVTFWLPPDVPANGPPDLDKLLRGVFDVLGAPPRRRPGETTVNYAKRCLGRGARVWEDDARVVQILWAGKRTSRSVPSGADIYVRKA